MTKYLCLTLFLAFTVGCHKGEQVEAEPKTIEITEPSPEIQIPTSLWDSIEGKGKVPEVKVEKKEAKEGGEGGGEGGAKSSTIEADSGALFMPVNVILEEKNSGVLKNPTTKIIFPRGGGVIDLASYVNEGSGSFYVKFEWPDADPEDGGPQAWFVSRAHKRKLGDEIWGAGCKDYFEITQGLLRANKGDGLKVNTTHERHLTVLGGHFVFSGRKSGQNFVSQVTFKDSRHPELFCQEL